MTSGQWDLNALEALEREALEVLDVLEVPEHVRRCSPMVPVSLAATLSAGGHHSHQHHPHHHQQQHQPTASMLQQQQQHHHQQFAQHPHHHATMSRPSHQHSAGATATSSGGGGGSSVGGCLGGGGTTEDGVDIELEDHIKHCSCTCNHMGYGNFMDYQTSCFGGLPDVTEHSHNTAQHKITRRDVSSASAAAAGAATISKDNLMDTDAPAVTHNTLVGCLSSSTSTTHKIPLSPVHDPSQTASLSTNVTNTPDHHQTILDSKEKLGSIDRKGGGGGGRRRPCVVGRCCLCVFLGTLLAVVLLGSVGFVVTHLGLADHFSGDRESHEQRVRIVRRLMRESPLIDGHNDLPWNIRSYAHNRLEYLNFSDGLAKTEPWSKSVWSQTDWPRMKNGMVGAQFWSAYVPCEAQGLDAVQMALEQIDLIQRFSEWHRQHMRLVDSADGIVNVHRNGFMASLIGVEGGHALGSSLSVLRSMYALGSRYLTLTHKCDNRWAGSEDSPDKGLSPFGRVVIKEMNRLGMMVDLSHSSDATARDVLRATRAPVIFSHSAARELCNSTRNIPDEILRSVAENGGIVMVSFYSLHVSCSRQATIRDVIAHINYIRTIAGVQHIGIGAGYDGIDATPDGLENVSTYPNLFAELLRDPNWTEDDLQLLAGKNLLRVFRSVENVRDYWKQAAISPMETISPPKPSPCTYMPS